MWFFILNKNKKLYYINIKMNFSLIVAHDTNFGIGINNDLPWKLKSDLKWFKENTLHKSIIMGSNTYFSIPNHPLKYRKNIVLSTDFNKIQQIESEGARCFYTIRDLEETLKHQEEEFIIIGGSNIYNQFINKINKIYLTEIYSDFSCNKFFPKVDYSKWNTIYESELQEENNITFKFKILNK